MDVDPERKGLVELYGKSLESFERTIVTVSSGALALSITFLHDVTPTPLPSSLSTLWWGWGGLLGSLGMMILSMPLGHWLLERALEKKDSKTLLRLVTVMNVSSVVLLLMGFGFLARFAQVNMFAAKPPTKPTAVTIQPAPPATAIPVQPAPSSVPQLPSSIPIAPPAKSAIP